MHLFPIALPIQALSRQKQQEELISCRARQAVVCKSGNLKGPPTLHVHPYVISTGPVDLYGRTQQESTALPGVVRVPFCLKEVKGLINLLGFKLGTLIPLLNGSSTCSSVKLRKPMLNLKRRKVKILERTFRISVRPFTNT